MPGCCRRACVWLRIAVLPPLASKPALSADRRRYSACSPAPLLLYSPSSTHYHPTTIRLHQRIYLPTYRLCLLSALYSLPSCSACSALAPTTYELSVDCSACCAMGCRVVCLSVYGHKKAACPGGRRLMRLWWWWWFTCSYYGPEY